MHCLCTDVPAGTPRGRETKPRTRVLPAQRGPVGGAGRASRKHRAGSLGQHPPETAASTSLWTDSSETSPGRAAFEKALKAKETGPVPKVKVTRGQRSPLSPADHPRRTSPAGRGGAGGPFAPKGRRSPSSQALAAGGGAGRVVHVQGAEPEVTALGGAPVGPQHPGVRGDLVQRGPLRGPQGQAPLDELLALCGAGGSAKGQLPVCRLRARPPPAPHTPGETLLRKKRRPRRISSSCSKGMSPHTMS